MKKFTFLLLFIFVLTGLNAQEWIEIPIPNADFTQAAVENVADSWMVTVVGETAAIENNDYEGTPIPCGVIGYTGDGTYKRGDYLNFTGANVADQAAEYKLSVPYVCSWIAAAKIDSFQVSTTLSVGNEGEERTVIATNSAWISVMKEWNTLESIGTVDAALLESLKGKQLVVEVGVLPNGMKDGAEIGTLAAWIRFSMVKLEYSFDVSALAAENVLAQTKVYASQNQLNIRNNTAQETTLMLYNLSGKLVKKNQINDVNSQLSLAGVNPGIYMVKLCSGQSTQTHKILVK